MGMERRAGVSTSIVALYRNRSRRRGEYGMVSYPEVARDRWAWDGWSKTVGKEGTRKGRSTRAEVFHRTMIRRSWG